MNEEQYFWQDQHIKEVDGRFICFDETGEQISAAGSIEEAREQLDYYDLYVLNNTTD